MSDTLIDVEQPIDLYKLGYMFALHKIDPKIGRIKASQTTWHWDGEKTKIDIPMVDCTNLLSDAGNPTAGTINEHFNPYTTTFRYKAEFVCPQTEKLIVQGHFGSPHFQYVSIQILGCDEEELPEGEKCSDKSEVDNLHVNFVGLQSHVDFS